MNSPIMNGRHQADGRRAGVWGRIIDPLAAAHDAAVQMIDTSIVSVRQHGACITRNRQQSSKIHAPAIAMVCRSGWR